MRVDLGVAQGELAAHRDLVASDRADSVAQGSEVVNKLHGHAVLGLPGEHEDGPTQIARAGRRRRRNLPG